MDNKESCNLDELRKELEKDPSVEGLFDLKTTSKLGQFEDNNFKEKLEPMYKSKFLEHRLLATVINAAFTEGKLVFILSTRGLSHLLKSDCNNEKNNSINGKEFSRFIAVCLEKKWFRKLVGQVPKGRAGAFELTFEYFEQDMKSMTAYQKLEDRRHKIIQFVQQPSTTNNRQLYTGTENTSLEEGGDAELLKAIRSFRQDRPKRPSSEERQKWFAHVLIRLMRKGFHEKRIDVYRDEIIYSMIPRKRAVEDMAQEQYDEWYDTVLNEYNNALLGACCEFASSEESGEKDSKERMKDPIYAAMIITEEDTLKYKQYCEFCEKMKNPSYAESDEAKSSPFYEDYIKEGPSGKNNE